MLVIMKHHHMTFQEWRPQTRRNKIALCIGLFSLLLFIGWNLAPMRVTRFDDESERAGMVIIHLWPIIFDVITDFSAFRNVHDTNHLFSAVVSLSILFLACLQLFVIPLWQMFSQSKILRWLAAVICFIWFGIFAYFLLPHINDWKPDIYFPLIMLNFLVLGIALVWFQNEERQALINNI